jgi:general secretion pathway protein F
VASAAEQRDGTAPKFRMPAYFRRVRISVQELANFTRQFATLLKSGTPLTESMRVLIEQTSGRRFEAVLRDVRERVTGGETLAEAFSNHPSVFNDLYVNMVRAGEASGRLDEVLFRIGEYLHRRARMRNKVMSALMYPIIIVCVGSMVVVVLMNLVVPQILKLITSKAGTMPLPTRILKSTSDVFTAYWPLMLAGVFALILLYGAVKRTEKGRYFLDKLKLRLPIFGDLFRKQAISRFAVTLSTLLKSGLPVLEGLKIVQNVVDNAVLAETVGMIHDRIVEGADIASPLQKSKMFPPVVGHMIAIGEQSGQLEGILSQLAESYDDEVDVATQRMTAILEPALIVAIAGVVAFIVLAIILPMLRLGNLAKG